MNKTRRKGIFSIRQGLDMLKSSLDFNLEKVRNVLDDEIDAHDNTPENLQSSDRYESAEDCIDCMSDAESELEEAVRNLESSIASLDEALDS